MKTDIKCSVIKSGSESLSRKQLEATRLFWETGMVAGSLFCLGTAALMLTKGLVFESC